jgi:hypothetical protein
MQFAVVDTGLFASDILSTPNPTIALVIPVNNAPLPTKALAFTYQLLQIYLYSCHHQYTTIPPALSVDLFLNHRQI